MFPSVPSALLRALCVRFCGRRVSPILRTGRTPPGRPRRLSQGGTGVAAPPHGLVQLRRLNLLSAGQLEGDVMNRSGSAGAGRRTASARSPARSCPAPWCRWHRPGCDAESRWWRRTRRNAPCRCCTPALRFRPGLPITVERLLRTPNSVKVQSALHIAEGERRL
jgi:hypothetical protein